MKKISLIALLLLSTSFAQLRVGADFSREMKLGGLDAEKSEGMGITLGYEKMLLGLIGAGGEFTLGGDEGPDMIYGYGVAKVPVGLPFFKGIVRMGYSMPVGEDGDMYDAGLAYGAGLRFKFPVQPIGIEVLYTIHNLEMKDQGDGFAELLDALDFTWNVMNITATYNF